MLHAGHLPTVFFDVLINACPEYRRTRDGFAFVHPEVTFVDTKQNVLLHERRDADAIVVQNQAILFEQLRSEGTVLA